MSALEGTPLSIALRDCGITSMALVGVAMEIGIEPTARHAADLGIVPVIVEDACGSGHAEAAQRSIGSLKFAGDAVFTDAEAFCQALKRKGGWTTSRDPSGLLFRWSAQADPELLGIVALSLRVSLTASIVALLIGAPIGAWLAIARFPGRQTIIVLTNALLGLPPVVVGLAPTCCFLDRGPSGPPACCSLRPPW
jgi:hypothetical protein